jgi:TRAP-type C4-dicarboxylate transport system permease small subunit
MGVAGRWTLFNPLCAILAGIALVAISPIVTYGVLTRCVLNSASSWPESMAILLTIALTFLGAAACIPAISPRLLSP